MRRTSSLLVALVLLACPRTALGDGPAPVAPIPPGDDRIEVLMQGQPAPYTGQLFDNKTALRWGNYLEQYRLRLRIDVEQAQKVDQAQIDFWKTKADLSEQRYTTVTVDYQKQVAVLQEELRNPPFYRSTWFGVALGVAGTCLAVGATAWLVHEVR